MESFQDRVFDWWLSEEDMVFWLAKGTIVVSVMVIVLLTLPIWFMPYIIYRLLLNKIKLLLGD